MKLLSISFAFLCLLQLYSQEDSEKIKFQGFSLSFPMFYNGSENNGTAANLDVGIYKNQHILKLSLLTGSETSLGLDNEESFSFSSADILYGRENRIKSNISIDWYIGLGVFRETTTLYKSVIRSCSGGFGGPSFCSYEEEEIAENRIYTLGIPLQLKLRFLIGKRFSMAPLIYGNINTFNTLINLGLGVQWNFNRNVLKD